MNVEVVGELIEYDKTIGDFVEAPIVRLSDYEALKADRDSWEQQAQDHLKDWDAMRLEKEALEAKLREAERDARRYRFLRKPGNAIVYALDAAWMECIPPASGHVRYDAPEQLDAAVDRAIASQAESGGGK